MVARGRGNCGKRRPAGHQERVSRVDGGPRARKLREKKASRSPRRDFEGRWWPAGEETAGKGGQQATKKRFQEPMVARRRGICHPPPSAIHHPPLLPSPSISLPRFRILHCRIVCGSDILPQSCHSMDPLFQRLPGSAAKRLSAGRRAGMGQDREIDYRGYRGYADGMQK